MGARKVAALGIIATLAGCAEAPAPEGPAAPTYEGVRTILLGEDLVSVNVRLRGSEDPEAVEDYARCAAARYALIRGYGFARHVRTRVAEADGLWVADAVYTVSEAFPNGVTRIDAEVLVEDCAERGIPTI